MEKKNKCITLGEFNKKYCYFLLGAFIINIFIIFLMIVFIFYTKDKKINIFNTLNILSYPFFLSFSEILIIIPDLILHKIIKPQKNNLTIQPTSRTAFKYIMKPYTKNFSIKEIIYLFFISLLKLILDILFMLYHYILRTNDNSITIINYYFQFELILLFLLNKILNKDQYYRHHHLAIIFLVFGGLLYFIYEFYDNTIDIFFLHLLCHLIYSFIKAFIILYIGGLMKYKFITPYKACYIFGLINFVIITIIFIISLFIPCDYILCKVEYNNKNYFGNIFTLFTIEELFIFLISIMKTALLLMNYIIMNLFTVFHSFLIVHYAILICNLFFYIIWKKFVIIIYLSINIIVTTFFLLLFLEIIEINICNISYYYKKNIIEREIEDSKLIRESNSDNKDSETEIELFDSERNQYSINLNN